MYTNEKLNNKAVFQIMCKHNYHNDKHINIIMQHTLFLISIVIYTRSNFLPFTNLSTLISRLRYLAQDLYNDFSENNF